MGKFDLRVCQVIEIPVKHPLRYVHIVLPMDIEICLTRQLQ